MVLVVVPIYQFSISNGKMDKEFRATIRRMINAAILG
jgi:hypothetical protein